MNSWFYLDGPPRCCVILHIVCALLALDFGLHLKLALHLLAVSRPLPAKITSDVVPAVIVPDPESIALGAEELEGEKHVLGRLGGGGDKPTGNANGRPAKTAIGAAIERSETARVAHEAALHRERMKHDREMAREHAQAERDREERGHKNNMELFSMMMTFMNRNSGGGGSGAAAGAAPAPDPSRGAVAVPAPAPAPVPPRRLEYEVRQTNASDGATQERKYL